MGAVFEALDTALGRKVALKVMLPAIASDPQARGRFLREARAAARVESDYIVPIYQVGEANGVPFIAMPLLSGETLDARLKGRRPLPLTEVLALGRHMAEALALAHAAGLIHRDIKPSNVWLDLAPDGTMRRARILDFGLARAPGDAILTGAGDVLGTPAYMSVEQARGQLVDFRTDLFSLGTVLYEAATGQRAFSGSTTYAILAVLATQTPPAPIQVNPALAPALSELIVKLMNKTPAGRPQSAQRVAEELARIAAAVASPVPAALGPALPPVPAAPGSRRAMPPLSTGSASMPALVETDSVVAMPTLTIAPEPAPAPEPLSLEPDPLPIPDPISHPTPSRGRIVLVVVAVVLVLVLSVLAFRKLGSPAPVPPPADGRREPGKDDDGTRQKASRGVAPNVFDHRSSI
jgi:serine/threonine protein kinase